MPKKKAKAKTKARTPRKVVRKAATGTRRKSRPKTASGAAMGSAARLNTVTHTELASSDPAATRAWCESVLGWRFDHSVPTPTGPYYMWQTKMGTGGGIRANQPPEIPGSIPYIEVADIKAAFTKAIRNGAAEMFGPTKLPGDSGWIAIVAAPGGVAVGFWAMK